MYSNYYALDPIGEDYIEQHGIRGQKWYHRNGPPYPLGSGKGSHRSAAEVALNNAKRGASAAIKGSAKVANSFNRIKAKKQAEVDAKNEHAKKAAEHRKQMRKGYHELSDDELNKRIDRLTKEQRYKQLVDSVYPAQPKKPGMLSSVAKGGMDAVGESFKKGVSKYMDSMVNKAVDQLLGDKEINLEWYNENVWFDKNRTQKEIDWMAKRATDFQRSYQGMSMMQHHLKRMETLHYGDDKGNKYDIGGWYDKNITKEQINKFRKQNEDVWQGMVSDYLKELGGRPIE